MFWGMRCRLSHIAHTAAARASAGPHWHPFLRLNSRYRLRSDWMPAQYASEANNLTTGRLESTFD